MSTLPRRIPIALAVGLLLGAWPAADVAARATVRAPAQRAHGLAVRVRRDRPAVQPERPIERPLVWRSHGPVLAVPYGYPLRTPAYAPGELADVREAALEAREAALDAREAALDLRTAVQVREDPPEPRGVLAWKPGGITAVRSGTQPPKRRTVFAEPVAPSSPATLVRLRYLPELLVPTCAVRVQVQPQQQRPQERRRFPWGLGWLARYGRDVDVERGGVTPPGYYLRSPLLSGLYRRPEDCPDDEVATCATVTLVGDDDAAVAVDVPLPQLEATTPRSLRDAIRAGLDDEHTVILRTEDGEPFDLTPGSVREIGASACVID